MQHFLSRNILGDEALFHILDRAKLIDSHLYFALPISMHSRTSVQKPKCIFNVVLSVDVLAPQSNLFLDVLREGIDSSPVDAGRCLTVKIVACIRARRRLSLDIYTPSPLRTCDSSGPELLLLTSQRHVAEYKPQRRTGGRAGGRAGRQARCGCVTRTKRDTPYIRAQEGITVIYTG